MNRMRLTFAAAAWLYAGGALAQTAAPASPPAQMPAEQKVHGIASAVTDKSVTLIQDDKSSVTVDVQANAVVSLIQPISIDQIQTGSHVSTVNKTQTDGSGIAHEILVLASPPHFTGNHVLDDKGTVSTSGVVTAVASVDDGRRLTIDYGSGTRQVLVPFDARMKSVAQVPLATVRAGDLVYVTTRQSYGTNPGQQLISIFRSELMK